MIFSNPEMDRPLTCTKCVMHGQRVRCWTYDEKVVSLTQRLATIKWLLLKWVTLTVSRQVNHLST